MPAHHPVIAAWCLEQEGHTRSSHDPPPCSPPHPLPPGDARPGACHQRRGHGHQAVQAGAVRRAARRRAGAPERSVCRVRGAWLRLGGSGAGPAVDRRKVRRSPGRACWPGAGQLRPACPAPVDGPARGLRPAPHTDAGLPRCQGASAPDAGRGRLSDGAEPSPTGAGRAGPARAHAPSASAPTPAMAGALHCKPRPGLPTLLRSGAGRSPGSQGDARGAARRPPPPRFWGREASPPALGRGMHTLPQGRKGDPCALNRGSATWSCMLHHGTSL